MELAIGTPQHGWLPVSLTAGSLHHEFNASNVLNDPFAEFLAAAVWAIDADYSFPVLPPNINQPVVTEDSRCVHLWLEPTWHTLGLKRLPDSVELHATLSLNTHSVLRVQEEDLRNSEATYFDRISAERFAALVQNAVQSLYFGAAAAEFDLHWRREVDRIQFQYLSTMIT